MLLARLPALRDHTWYYHYERGLSSRHIHHTRSRTPVDFYERSNVMRESIESYVMTVALGKTPH